jgi:hypothetical protein
MAAFGGKEVSAMSLAPKMSFRREMRKWALRWSAAKALEKKRGYLLPEISEGCLDNAIEFRERANAIPFCK